MASIIGDIRNPIVIMAIAIGIIQVFKLATPNSPGWVIQLFAIPVNLALILPFEIRVAEVAGTLDWFTLYSGIVYSLAACLMEFGAFEVGNKTILPNLLPSRTQILAKREAKKEAKNA